MTRGHLARRHAAAAPADPDAAIGRARMQVAAGARPDLDDLPDEAARALRVAERVGAPLVPVLDASATARRHQQRLRDGVRAATAPARAVGLGLVALPVIVVPAMGRILDVDLGAFYTTPVGMVVGGVGVTLWAAGAAAIATMVRRTGRDAPAPGPLPRMLVAGTVGWLLVGPVVGVVAAVAARLTFRPTPSPPHPDLADTCELLAAVLQAGLPIAAGLREIAADVPRLTAPLRRLALLVELGRLRDPTGAPAELVPLADTLVHAAATGGPVSPALRSQGRRLRDRRAAVAHEQAQRLPAHLVFPTALLLLPATVVLIGAPIVVTGLSVVSGT